MHRCKSASSKLFVIYYWIKIYPEEIFSDLNLFGFVTFWYISCLTVFRYYWCNLRIGIFIIFYLCPIACFGWRWEIWEKPFSYSCFDCAFSLFYSSASMLEVEQNFSIFSEAKAMKQVVLLNNTMGVIQSKNQQNWQTFLLQVIPTKQKQNLQCE